MTELIQKALPIVVLVSHLLFVFLLAALIFKRSWGGSITQWLGRNAISLGLSVSLAAVLGSVFYSNVVGFPPCVLCWWQRVFLFPTLVVFAVSLWKKRADAYAYAAPLAIMATVIALYHAYSNLGGGSLLPCTAEGGECSRLYVMAFGYITIPMMSLTVALYILILAWARKIYENHSHA